MLEKCSIFSANNNSPNELEKNLSGVQTQMFIRLLIGVASEGWRLVGSRFLSSKLGKVYLPKIDERGQLAIQNLKKQFGSSVLAKIRNNYSFHFPENKELEAAFRDTFTNSEIDHEWNFYFAQSGYNSLFYLSDVVMVQGIVNQTGLTDFAEAQKKNNE